MTLIDLTQDEQTMLINAMQLKLWEMARQGASAAQLKAFEARMSEIENPCLPAVLVGVRGGVAEVQRKSLEDIIVLIYDYDEEAASAPGTYTAERC